jgi:hypothetical protein
VMDAAKKMGIRLSREALIRQGIAGAAKTKAGDQDEAAA